MDMDSLAILVKAILSLKDTAESEKQIISELPKLEDKLQSNEKARVKIIAGLDVAKSKKVIQSQIDTLSSQLNGNTIKVGLEVTKNNGIQNIVGGLKQAEIQAQKTAKSLKSIFDIDVVDSKNNPFKFDVARNGNRIDIKSTLDNARKLFNDKGFSDITLDWADSAEGAFDRITVSVKDAYGAVQDFKFITEEDSNFFKYYGGSGTDKGVKKLSTQIEETRAKYSRLLADFKSTNSAIESGLTSPVEEFEAVLNGLGKTSSINDVKNAFESLKQSASEITRYLDTTNSSFNKATNAVNNYKNMDNILKEMSTTFDNLTIKPEGLRSELDKVEIELKELQKIEEEQGYSLEWAKKYHEVNLEVSKLKANIELAAKAESKSQKADKNSAYQTQLKYLNKIKEETNTIISLKKKIINAGEEESAVYQHEITKAQKRIQYDVQQLQKKKLLTNEAQRLVNTYQEEIALQDRINSAKSSDKAITQQISDMKAYQKQIENTISSLDGLYNKNTFTKNKNNPQVSQVKAEIDSIRTEYQKLYAELQVNPTSQGLETVKTKLTELDKRFKTATASADAFEKELKSETGSKALKQRIQLLTQQIKAFQTANTKASKIYSDEFAELFAGLDNPNIDERGFNQLYKKFQILRQEIKATGNAGKTVFQTLGDQIKKFTSWMTLTGVISSLWREMKQMVTNVIELDSAMTNLKKVTDETEVTYTKFLKNVSKQAQELHSTMVDLIEQTSEWAKLGYDLNQTNQLSRASMIYANVGEVDNEQAVTNIVSAMKAFDIAVEDVMSIPDVYNKLGNEFAVSSKNLGAGMSQAATTMALAGNDFNQVAALLTGAGEILGDNKLDEIGNGLKTVTLRIQNQAGALKELGEEYEDLVSVSKTQQQIYELTGGTVNIMSETDPNEFRSTYDILKDVSVVIKDLNDTEASELIQLLFGKNRANVGTAVLKAFQSGQIEKAYDAALGSDGSAEKEFEKWTESIEASIKRFTAAFEGLSATLVDDGFIKDAIDTGTDFLNLITDIVSEFGLLQTLIPAVFAGLSFKNVGGLYLNTPPYAPLQLCA